MSTFNQEDFYPYLLELKFPFEDNLETIDHLDLCEKCYRESLVPLLQEQLGVRYDRNGTYCDVTNCFGKSQYRVPLVKMTLLEMTGKINAD